MSVSAPRGIQPDDMQVMRGVLYTQHEAEGRRMRHPLDTVTEGVGLNRLTHNFSLATIDGAFRCSDQEAVDMGQFLLRQHGLWVGSSSAVNCVGAVKAARRLGPGHTIVTVLCDGGRRHASKFYNAEFLREHGLMLRSPPADLSWIGV
jgi:cysteine synthase